MPSREQACDAALDAIGSGLGFPRASVLLEDVGVTGVMRFVAWRGLSETYRRAVEGHSPWRLGERSAQPICIADTEVPGVAGDLAPVLLAEGIRALAFIPVTVDGGVAGKFMIYSDEPRSFSERELELALIIARQLGFFLERSQADSARRLLAAAVDSSGDAILTKDLQGVITSWNQGAERLFGFTAEEVIGKSVTILIPLDRQNEEPAILERIRNGERVHYETVRQRRDGSLVDISLTVSPIEDSSGRTIGASKIVRDITARRRALDQQQMLLREMDHRIKNLFTLAAGVVSLSAPTSESPEALADAVQERLTALARAHTLTLPRAPLDAGTTEATGLHALITAIVAPYGGDDARITISGDDCQVSGHAITSLALLFNEFATNAVKYGSLSRAEGSVAVSCLVTGDRIEVTWVEQGGPPILTPGLSSGFGSVLAESTVKRQLAGQLSHDWRRDGLVIRLVALLERITG